MDNDRVELRIGIAGPFSGPRAEYGELLIEAAERAVARLDAEQASGPEIRLVVADDAADPQTALAAARKLLADGVAAVIGHFNSDAATAAGPLYRAAGIPLLLPAATRDGLAAEIGACRLCPTDLDQVSTLAAAVLEEKAVIIACDATPYAARLFASLEEELAKREVNVTRHDLQAELPTAGGEAGEIPLFLLGTHPALLQALARWSERELLHRRRILACDDCSLPAFAAALPAGVAVEVATPEPSFAQAVGAAIDIIARHATLIRDGVVESSLAEAVLGDPLFSDFESVDARFFLRNACRE